MINNFDFFQIISMVISILSFITTVVVVIFNYRSVKAAELSVKAAEKSIELTKIEIQKSIDLQLYDKRLSIANHLEVNDYSDSVMEVALLFGNDIYKQIRNIKKMIQEKNNYELMEKRYDELLDTHENGDKFKRLYKLFFYHSYEISEEEYEQYEELYEMYYILIDYTNDDEVKYDIKNICEEKKRLYDEIEIAQKQLKIDVLKLMKQKLSLE